MQRTRRVRRAETRSITADGRPSNIIRCFLLARGLKAVFFDNGTEDADRPVLKTHDKMISFSRDEGIRHARYYVHGKTVPLITINVCDKWSISVRTKMAYTSEEDATVRNDQILGRRGRRNAALGS